MLFEIDKVIKYIVQRSIYRKSFSYHEYVIILDDKCLIQSEFTVSYYANKPFV